MQDIKHVYAKKTQFYKSLVKTVTSFTGFGRDHLWLKSVANSNRLVL